MFYYTLISNFEIWFRVFFFCWYFIIFYLSSALQLKNDRDPVLWPIDSNVLLEKALDDISFNIQRLETWNKSNQANIEDIQKKMESQYQHFDKTIEDTKNGNSKVFISLDE